MAGLFYGAYDGNFCVLRVCVDDATVVEMADVPLVERVEVLEAKVQALEGIPAQIVRLESTLRDEIRSGDEETRRLIRERDKDTRREMRVLHEAIIERLKVLGEANDKPARQRNPRR